MILVTDATGRIGNSVARQLAASGHPVRVFGTSSARISKIDSKGRQSTGLLTDSRALARALEGVRTIVLVTGSAPEQIATQDRVIAHARVAGVERIIKLSTAGAGLDACCESARWHGRIEQQLIRSGIPSCSVRATRLMQSLEAQVPLVLSAGIIAGCQGTGRTADVDVRDVVAVLVTLATRHGDRIVDDALTDVTRISGADDAVFEAFDLTGPAAFSRAEVARILSMNLGRPISYVDCAPSDLLQCAEAAGLPHWQAQDQVAYELHAREGRFERISGAAHQLLGRSPRDFASFAHEFAFSVRYSQAPGMLDAASPTLVHA